MCGRSVYVRIIAVVSSLVCVTGASGSLAPQPSDPSQPASELTILYAPGPIPGATAAETMAFLTTEGIFHDVELLPVSDGPSLERALANVNTESVAIIAHGSPEGLHVGPSLLAWDTLRSALLATPARAIYVGACFSDLIGAVPGHDLRTTITGEMDHRYVAGKLAADFVDHEHPELRFDFDRTFLTAIEARGGIGRYARLLIAPESPLREVSEGAGEPNWCQERQQNWYAGRVDPAKVNTNGICAWSIDAESTNCFSPRDRGSPACYGFRASDQNAWASQENSFAPGGEFAEGIYQLRFGSTPFRSGDDLRIQLGSSEGAACGSATVLKGVQLGGWFVQKTFFETYAAANPAGMLKLFLGKDTADIGIYFCSRIDLQLPAFYAREWAIDGYEMSASGSLDAFAGARWRPTAVTIFSRWTWTIGGAEGGFHFPVAISAAVRGYSCYADNGWGNWTQGEVAYSLDLELNWKDIGAAAKLTAARDTLSWAYTWQVGGTYAKSLTKSCPPGNSTYHNVCPECDAGTSSRAASPGTQSLVDAGLATIDPKVPGEADLVKLRILEPGTAEYERLAADGTLERLGVPAQVPTGSMVALDVASPAARMALGWDGEARPSRVRLVADAVVVPPGIDLLPAHTAYCEDMLGKLTATAQSLAIPNCGSTIRAGSDPEPNGGIWGPSLPFFPDYGPTNDAYGQARGIEIEQCYQLLEYETGACSAMYGGDDAAESQDNGGRLWVVHTILVALDRSVSQTLITACALDLDPLLSDTVGEYHDRYLTNPVTGPGICMELEDVAATGAMTVIDQFNVGYQQLATMQANSWQYALDAMENEQLTEPVRDAYDELVEGGDPVQNACEAAAYALGRDPQDYCSLD